MGLADDLADDFKEREVRDAMLPATRTAAALGRPAVMSIERALGAWGATMELCGALVSTGFLPTHIKTPAQAAAIVLTGNELGFPAMYALRHLYIVPGGNKPTLDGSALQSLIYRDHGDNALRIIERSAERSVIDAKRRGQPDYTRFIYTIEEAQGAGLCGKDVWKKYPQFMLHWRNVSAIANAMFSDSTAGLLTPEELGTPVAVNPETGEVNVVETTGREVPPQPPEAPKGATAPPKPQEAAPEAPLPLSQAALGGPDSWAVGDTVTGTVKSIQPADKWMAKGTAFQKAFSLKEFRVSFLTLSNPEDPEHPWPVGTRVSFTVDAEKGKAPTWPYKDATYCRVSHVRPVASTPPASDLPDLVAKCQEWEARLGGDYLTLCKNTFGSVGESVIEPSADQPRAKLEAFNAACVAANAERLTL